MKLILLSLLPCASASDTLSTIGTNAIKNFIDVLRDP